MRRAARTDTNQAELVEVMRQMGASVQDLSMVGSGCPDLVVGFRGRNYMVEIKTEKGKLRTAQHRWHGEWRGHVSVIRTVDDAVALLGGHLMHEQLGMVP